MELVLEFYLNIYAIQKESTFFVHLRDVTFCVTPNIISSVLGIPRVLDLGYPFTNDNVLDKSTMIFCFVGGDQPIQPPKDSIVEIADFTSDTVVESHHDFQPVSY